MSRLGAVLVLVFAFAMPVAAQYVPPRSQLGLELGPTWAGAVTYARRVEASPLLVGFGAGFGWELNSHTFDGQFWNVLHLGAFGRYQPTSSVQAELGLSVASSSPTDDTAENRVFGGLYSSVLLGHGFLFIGPQARLGFLGSDFGAVWNVVVRGVLPFGSWSLEGSRG